MIRVYICLLFPAAGKGSPDPSKCRQGSHPAKNYWRACGKLHLVCPADGDPVQAGHDNWLGFVASMAAIHVPDFLGGISR